MPTLTRRRKLLTLVFGFALLAAFVLPFLRPAPPAPRYSVTDLGVLPGGSDSHTYGLNAKGVVCGYTQQGFSERPCVFQNGKVTVLGILAGTTSSDAMSINALGEVTGHSRWPNPPQAFLSSGGRLRSLGTLPGYNGSQGNAINDWGEVAGALVNYAARPRASSKHAFLYSHGRMTDLGTLPGAIDSAACGLNGIGQVVGDCHFRGGRSVPFFCDTRRKTMTALPIPATTVFGRACAINDHGQIAGQIVSTAGTNWITHAVLWSAGRMTDLGAPAGYDDAEAEALNSRGDIVGQCYRQPSAFQALLQRNAGQNNPWQRYVDRDCWSAAFLNADGKMQDLNMLIPKEEGWRLEEAHCINDRGQIAGTGLHNGLRRAFLLTPR